MLTQEEECEWRERGCAEGWQGEKGKGEGKEDEFSGGDCTRTSTITTVSSRHVQRQEDQC